MPQFPAVFNLSSLTGSNGFRLTGIDVGDYCGHSVASAGDINGDGFGDIIVGAEGGDRVGAEDAGESYVIFGKATGFAAAINLSSLNGNNGFRLNGVAVGDYSGFSVASAGDVNGDGKDDIIIGAKNTNDGPETQVGASYVVFGKSTGFASTFELSALNGSNGFRIIGKNAFDNSGYSVAPAGDVNGDGFGDIIIGAHHADPGGDSNAGESYVVFGKASGFAATLNLSALSGSNGFRLEGIDLLDFSGNVVAAAGDVNGDSFDDIIISGQGGVNALGDQVGESYVVFGKSSGFTATLSLGALNGTNGFRLNGIDEGDASSSSVASAGDVNGDGFSDIIIGADHADPGNIENAGESYVVFGKATGFSAAFELSTLNGTNGFRLDGIAELSYSVTTVAAAGDVNGDGFGDIIIGSNHVTSGIAGQNYVVFGKATGFAASLQLSSLNGNNGFRIDGVADGDKSGKAVAAAGDVNGDGFGDLIVGAEFANPGGDNNAGESYVIFGHRADTAVSITGTDRGLTHNGGKGADTINALGGNDKIFGWEGKDTLTGGTGADKFYFNTALNATTNVDKITSLSSIDKIVLDNDIFTGLGTGFTTSEFRSIATGTSFASVDSSDNIIYLKSTGDLYYDRDGSGSTYAAIKFADLTANTTVNFSHFLLVE